MTNNMKLFLELVANSAGFRREMGQSASSVSKFVRSAQGEIAALKRTFGGLKGQLAGLGLGLGAIKIAGDSARLDKSLTQIGQTAGATSSQVKDLRKEIFLMSQESGQQVEGLKDGFNSLIQSGQSWKAALESTKGINIASAVTGSDQAVLAGGLTVGAQAFNIDLEKPGKALELLDKMVVAGRQGNAELENLSDIFGRIGPNAAAAGLGFDKTLAFIEGLSLAEKNPERLATLADSTLRLFNNMRYSQAATQATGISFFDAKGGRRDPVAVLKDFRAQYSRLRTDQEKAIWVQKVLGKADLDTIKGFRTLLSGDNLERISQFTDQLSSAGGTLKRDMKEATDNMIDQGGRLKNNLRQAADSFASPINKVLADLIGWSMAKKKDGGLELSGGEMIAGGAGLTLATILTARYGNKALGGLASKLLKKGSGVAAGVAEGKALEAAAGVTPVFVVNMPAGGGIPGAVGPGGGSVILDQYGKPLATGGAAASTMAGSSLLSKAGLAGGAAFASYWITSQIDKLQGGTGELSSIYSDKAMANDWVMSAGVNKNDITLNVSIDKDNRVKTETSDPNSRARVNVKRGSFMAAH